MLPFGGFNAAHNLGGIMVPIPYSDDGDGPPPSGDAGVYGINVTPPVVDIGGEAYMYIGYDGPDGTTLSVTSTNPQAIAVMTPSPTVEDGVAKVEISGVGAGTASIVATDGEGDYGSTEQYGASQPQVGANMPGQTQGASYDSGDEPGFNFEIATPSLSNVIIHYNTSGSTLPATLMGNLSGGSVTIPAGDTSVFVPFVVPDDGKIAPCRFAVLNLEVPGVPLDQTDTAKMNVYNNEEPIITMNGQSNNASIALDPQGDNSDLTAIALNSTNPDCQITSWSLSWPKSQFIMWRTDQVGQPGTDLGSVPMVNGFGSSYDSWSGLETYTGRGAPPADVYGQDLGGSSTWDSTSIQLTVNAMVAPTVEPGGSQLPAETASPSNQSSGTANGVLIYNGGSLLVPSNVVIGRRMNLTAVWVGPGTPANNAQVQWQIGGKVVKQFWVSADDSVGGPIPLTFTSMPYVSSNGSSNLISFIWYAAPTTGQIDNVTCSLAGSSETVGLNVASPEAKVDVYTGNVTHQGVTVTVEGLGGKDLNHPGNNVVSSGNESPNLGETGAGIAFSGFAKEPFALTGGKYEWVQIVTENEAFASNRKTTNITGLDGNYPYAALKSFPDTFETGPGYGDILPLVMPQAIDEPLVSSNAQSFGKTFEATMTLMYEPANGGAQDWVPLASIQWYWFARFSNGEVLYNYIHARQVDAIYPTWISIVPRKSYRNHQ
jgi:hypothetical protein